VTRTLGPPGCKLVLVKPSTTTPDVHRRRLAIIDKCSSMIINGNLIVVTVILIDSATLTT